MNKSNEIVMDILNKLDAALREEYEERAAIMEFDGNLPRKYAECLALLTVLHHHPYAQTGLRIIQISLAGEPRYMLCLDAYDTDKVLRNLSGPLYQPLDPQEILKNQFSGAAVLVKLN